MKSFPIRTALACFAAAITFSAQAQPVQLNLGHTLAPDSHYQFMSQRMADLVAKKSNGEMRINLFPQSQLGGEVKMIQAGRTGGLDLFITAQAPLVNTVKAYSLSTCPIFSTASTRRTRFCLVRSARSSSPCCRSTT